MPFGKIKKIVQEKGFGFIQGEGGTDVFFHHSVVANRAFDSLAIGQQVEYSVDDSPNPGGKGPRAASVKPA